jgi:hypothetical protein
MLAAKHPALADKVFNQECLDAAGGGAWRRWFRAPAGRVAAALIERGLEYPWSVRLFWWAWKMEYCEGVREGRRLLDRSRRGHGVGDAADRR